MVGVEQWWLVRDCADLEAVYGLDEEELEDVAEVDEENDPTDPGEARA